MGLNQWRNLVKVLNRSILISTPRKCNNLIGTTNWRCLASKAGADNSLEIPVNVIPPEEEGGLSEEEILRKRNKSRLRPWHERIIREDAPHPTPVLWTHHTVRYKRRAYGQYGESSGVNPGLMWPTHEELAERLEFERVAFPLTFQEMVEKRKELRRLEKEQHEKRRKEIETKMGMVEKMKQDIINKKLAKEREAEAAKAKREALMEEVRRHFGYTVDPRDERFQELLEKKEKAQRKAQKEAKKAERQRMLMERLSEGLTKETQIPPINKSTAKSTAEEDEDDDEPPTKL